MTSSVLLYVPVGSLTTVPSLQRLLKKQHRATTIAKTTNTEAEIPTMYFNLLLSSVSTGVRGLPPFVGTEAVRGTAKDGLKFRLTFLVS